MNAKPSISLIFVNYRSARYLSAALESLFSFEREADSFEIIVVNNDPAESAAVQTLQQTFSFQFIESGENRGFSRGNNLGAKQALGAILGFINPDVLWTGPYLRKIAQVFDKNTRIGVLGMALLDTEKRSEAWSYGKEPSLVTLFFNNLFPAQCDARLEREAFFPDWVSGGALFVRAELFAEIGGFDEQFFLYFEDVDLCKEARQRGFLVMGYPEFSLIHLGGKSRESRRLQKKHYALSQRKYFRKHRPRWEGRILESLQFIFRKM